jgi:TatD DNase family protein
VTAGAEPPATWIDTHAHLDDDAFAVDRAAVIEAAVAAGVRTIVNIGYRPERWATTLSLADRFPVIRFALGIHPGHADEFSAAAVDDLAATIGRSRAVAVGEIGLDFFHRSNPPAAVQREALRQQLRLARTMGLPAIIHQRAAEAELIAVVEAEPDPPPLVLHSFDGGPRYAAFARERGSYVGVGGLATKSAAAALRDLLATLSPQRVLLETDAPYLVPAGVRGRRNEPANVPTIGRRLGAVWGYEPDAFAALTTANAGRALGLTGGTTATEPTTGRADGFESFGRPPDGDGVLQPARPGRRGLR